MPNRKNMFTFNLAGSKHNNNQKKTKKLSDFLSWHLEEYDWRIVSLTV